MAIYRSLVTLNFFSFYHFIKKKKKKKILMSSFLKCVYHLWLVVNLYAMVNPMDFCDLMNINELYMNFDKVKDC